MKQKYIVGDVVMYDNKIMVIKEPRDGSHFDLSCPKEGLVYCLVGVEDIKPVVLTPEILEKNGWEKDNSKFDEYDDYPEYENRYFNWTYDLTLDLDDCSVYKGTSGILYGLLYEVIYVHQLQHLLFGLGINHEMEV